MSISKNTTVFCFLFITFCFGLTHAARFDILNNCPYTVWAAAVPGGGRQLSQSESWARTGCNFDGSGLGNCQTGDYGGLLVCQAYGAPPNTPAEYALNQGESWALDVNAGTTGARIWARTGCNFDGASGRGNCQTGDCDGLLECQAYGAPPNTVAEYSLNQYSNLDFFDISLVDGFNVPMDFSPTSNGCTRGIKCTADINGQCPNELKALGGCNNPCTVFKTDQYCCNSGSCGPTNYSRFFKTQCPDAYSYPKDDATSTFTCPAGTNYKVVFCP